MKKITLKEALGKTNYKIAPEINEKHKVRVSFPDDEVKGDSLVYYTEKDGCEPLKISFPAEKPCAAVINNDCNLLTSDIPVIRTDSVRAALAYAYSNQYGIGYDKMKIIGVTGTNGKTTTVSMIEKILRKILTTIRSAAPFY